MAKKSSIEKNKRRRQMAKSFAGRRSRLKAIVNDKTKPMEERFHGLPEACRIAAQFVEDAHPQSLRGDRSSARLLPQAEDVAYRAARARQQGPDPGPREVELVREDARWP